jgi:ribonuclease BN (tRNA processing enzyme)
LFNDFKINLDVKEISNEKIDSNEIIIESLEMKHGLPCNAYSIIIPDKLRIDKKKLKKLKIPNSSLIGDLQKGRDVMFNGKKITSKSVTYLEKGKKVTFILDTGINENAFQIAKNSDILID